MLKKMEEMERTCESKIKEKEEHIAQLLEHDREKNEQQQKDREEDRARERSCEREKLQRIEKLLSVTQQEKDRLHTEVQQLQSKLEEKSFFFFFFLFFFFFFFFSFFGSFFVFLFVCTPLSLFCVLCKKSFTI